MKIIGLTGGIGSGKSTIAKMFEKLGVPVYYADIEAKRLMSSSKKIKEKIILIFGKEAFADHKLNRNYLAQIVFKDKKKLQILNNIVHPEVKKHFKSWIKKQNSDYILQENAIIFESKHQSDFDDIIVVTAPDEIKIKRVMQRDHIPKSLVVDRMKNQFSDQSKIIKSKYHINNTDLKESEKEVLKIHHLILVD